MSGFFVTRKRLGTAVNERLGITLMSDLHVDSAITNLSWIDRELREARDNGDRILIAGDVFDGILPSDKKRYSPQAMRDSLRGRDDILNAAVDLAVSVLGPYADQIDMISCGNHEASIVKHHSVDPIILLLDGLSGKCSNGHKISYGGYTGFVEYTVPLNGSSRRLVIYYHHGSGGSSPVTKGFLDFSRKGVFVDSDVVWSGHLHTRITDTGATRLSCPSRGDSPSLSQQVFVRTGAYMDTHSGQTQASLKTSGRMANYASDSGTAPQWPGGARLLVQWDSQRNKSIRVVS